MPDDETSRDEGLARVLELLPEIGEIGAEDIRQKVTEIWLDLWRESDWTDLGDVPKNPETVPLDRTLVDHTRSVARQAVATAEIIRDIHGIAFDRDALLAIALLHDVSKTVEYEPTPGGAAKARIGELFQHGFNGAEQARLKGLTDEVVHGIIVHTTYSRHAPRTWEAILVHYVDYLDTDALAHATGGALHLTK